MGIPARPRSVYDTSGDQRSYSLTNFTDASFNTPCPSPAIRRTPSRPGPAVRKNYQRAASWSQIPPDWVRRVREQYPHGNSLDLQLYAGLPSGLPPRESAQRHSTHGFTAYEQINERSRTYSISSMRSMRNSDSTIGYSHQMHRPQNSINSLHYQNRHDGGSHSRAHSGIYENGYQDDVWSARSGRRSSVISQPPSPPLPLQREQPTPQYGNINQGMSYQQYLAPSRGERQKRVSRRSSYSKLLGIPPEEEKKMEGEGFEAANESFRNSTYGWDLPGMSLPMLNLCPESTEAQAASAERDGQDERRKLNDTEYTTTLESTARPYTPDKFITVRSHLKDLQPNKAVKNTCTSGTTTRPSGWNFGKWSAGSLKVERNDLDLDLVPTQTNEGEPIKVPKEGKKLLKKFRSKTPRPSLDLDGIGEAIFVSKNKAVTSFEGFLGRKSDSWREQDGTADIDPQIEMNIIQPYTATTKAGATTGLIKKAKRPLTNLKDVTIPPDAELQVNVAPVLLLRPADKLAAYVRGKCSALREWRVRIISVKPKDIPTTVTAEIVISEHKRIPSRASTPVQRTIKTRLTPTGAVEGTQPVSPGSSLANLKRKIMALSTKRLWEEKVKSTTAAKARSESIDIDLTVIARTRSAHTVASSFNIKVVPERIGTDNPSGFEVVGGKGAGRAWGVEAPVSPEIPEIGQAITSGSSEAVATSECVIPGRHSLGAGQVGGGHGQQQGMWKWLGERTTPRKRKLEPLLNNRLRIRH